MVRRATRKSADQLPRALAMSDFENITPERAALLRLLSAPQLPDWLESIFAVDVRRSRTLVPDGAMLIVDFRCPGGTLSLGFSIELMPALTLAVHAETHSDVRFATLVAARLLAPLLEQFGQAARRAGDGRWHAMRVVAIRNALDTSGPIESDTQMPLAAWDVVLTNHVTAKLVLLAVDLDCAAALQEMLDTRPVRLPSPTTSWSIATTLRIASGRWSTSVLRSLEAGDVLLIEGGSNATEINGQLFCGSTAGRHWRCLVRVMKEKVTMTSEIDNLDGSIDIDGDPAAPIMEQDVAELQVPVHFELDSAALSLAQLSSLRPGYVINLSLPVNQAEIRLVACGQLIGRGKLVVIGDCLGVQIEHIVNGRA